MDPTTPEFPEFTDDNVNVFAGGSLTVVDEAAEAEGRVVVLNDATFTRATPGTYNVGVVGVGTGVVPPPGSDMLTVAGNLGGNAVTRLDVGSGVGGGVTVEGAVQPGFTVDTKGGTVSSGVADATFAYGDIPELIAAKSRTLSALPATGNVVITPFSVTATGDDTSNPQVFRIDADALGTDTRSLQFLGVPADAAIHVTVTGTTARINFNALLGPDGAVVDPFSDPFFVDLTTRLLWNVPDARTATFGGSAQLPGSILAANSTSTTTITVPGTNGRVWVAGNLVHGGTGTEMHNYPYDPDEDLACKPTRGALSVVKLLDDPAGVVADDRVFTGTYDCELDGQDVTPSPATWQLTPAHGRVLLSDDLPLGAVCTLTEQPPPTPPAAGYEWAPVEIVPTSVTITENEVLGFSVTNTSRPTGPTASGTRTSRGGL